MGTNKPRVLDVGQCDYDHGHIRQLLATSFEADVQRSHSIDDAINSLHESNFDLVLVNRIFDRGGAEGLDLVKQMKSDDAISNVPVMIISNYADAQEKAVAAGAVRGFGKSALTDRQTLELLSEVLKSPR